MQTFLPYPDFGQSAKVLDMRRLGKQRVEVLQIVGTLCEDRKGWRNHPAVRMWRGYEPALALYGDAVCLEWTSRGYRDTCRDKIRVFIPEQATGEMPPWLGDPALHASHRSNLLRKDVEWYGKFNWEEDGSRPYVWPV